MKTRIFAVIAFAAVFCFSASADEWKGVFKSGAYVIAKQADGSDLIEMQGFGNSSAPGDPELPSKVFNIALPPGTDFNSVEIFADNADWEDIPGDYNIAPAPPCAMNAAGEETLISFSGNEGKIKDGKNLGTYGADRLFPENPLVLLPYSQMRKWKYVRIVFHPFQCNPVTGKLRLCKSIGARLAYKTEKAKDAGSIKKEIELLDDTKFDRRAMKLLYNASEAIETYTEACNLEKSEYVAESGNPLPNPVAYNYVIITTNAIESNLTKLDDFVSHLQYRGFSVLVVTEDDFSGLSGQSPNGTAEKIRQWLINNYASYGIEYVLLIGNPDPTSGDIPMKMCKPSTRSGYEYSPTDYFYADLTGNWDLDSDGVFGEYSGDRGTGGVDFAEEVYVGRIPLYSAAYSTTDGILQKIIDYDNVGSTPAWRKKILIPMAVSNYLESANSPTKGPNAPKLAIDNYASAAGFDHFVFYEKAGIDPLPDSSDYDNSSHIGLTQANIKTEWANNYGCVLWWGHGSSTGVYRRVWNSDDGDGYCESGEYSDTLFFGSGDTSALSDSYPSITFQVSCTNGYPESSTNLGYSLLKRGAIATNSASRVSWYRIGTWITGTSPDNMNMGYVFFKNICQSNQSFGEANANCRNETILSSNPWSSGESYMNRMDFNLYGPPHSTLEPLADATAPAEIADLSHSSKSGNSVTLSWTAPGDDGNFGTAASYDVRYSTSSINEGNWAAASQASGEPAPSSAGSPESFTVASLLPSTTYYFAIKSSDEVPNTSGISNVYSVTTDAPDSTAPAAVANLAVSSTSNSSISLQFTAPGDDGSSGTASSYDIRYSTSSINDGNWADATQASGEPAPSIAGSTENFTVTGLSPGTTYYFAMKSSDETPNISALSNLCSGATNAILTYSGTGFMENSANDGSIDNSSPMTISLAGASFTGTNGDDFVLAGKIAVTNLPSGLTAVATRNSGTELSVTLTGNAVSHEDDDDLSDLSFTFQDSGIVGGNAGGIVNYAKTDLSIDFDSATTPADWFVSSSGNDTTGNGSEGNPYATIAKAIAMASAGQIIEVMLGTITENNIGVSKSLTIRGKSRSGTIVLANASRGGYTANPVFRISASNVSINSMTVKHGGYNYGAAVMVNGASVDNTLLEDCLFTANNSTGGTGGGPVCLYDGVKLTVRNCDFYDNQGGIWINDGTGIIENSSFRQNTYRNTVYVSNASTVCSIRNCTVANNVDTATARYGGVYVSNGSMTVSSCTITGNTGSGSYAGGVLRLAGTCNLYNNIIHGNFKQDGTSAHDTWGTFAEARFNIIGTSTGSTFTVSEQNQIGTNPLLNAISLVDGSYLCTLQEASPAIDKGKNLTSDSNDQRGDGFDRTYDNPAIANATGGDGTDIGAYEGQAPPPPDEHTVNFFAGTGGTLSGTTSQTVSDGGDCSAVTAVPNSGWRFANWTGDYSGTENPLTVTDVAEDMDITANFARISPEDFNGDSNSDVICESPVENGFMYFMNGVTPSAPASAYDKTDKNWKVANLADFNGDGKTDMLWRHDVTGQTLIYIMNGNVVSSAKQLYGATTSWNILAVNDFNGDGKADVLIRHTDGSCYLYIMNGATPSDQGTVYVKAPSKWTFKTASDFDGDGKCDMLWQDSVGEGWISKMEGKSVVSETKAYRMSAGSEWQTKLFGDFNGDSKTDMLWEHSSSGSGYVYLMDGAAILPGSGYIYLAKNANWNIVSSGDFNADGKVDILWEDSINGIGCIYLMNGAAISDYGNAYDLKDVNPATKWDVVKLLDFNADGKADMLWESAATKKTLVYLMDGFSILSSGTVYSNGNGWNVMQ